MTCSSELDCTVVFEVNSPDAKPLFYAFKRITIKQYNDHLTLWIECVLLVKHLTSFADVIL